MPYSMPACTESRIPYEVIYYCYVRPRGPQAEIWFMVSKNCWLFMHWGYKAGLEAVAPPLLLPPFPLPSP